MFMNKIMINENQKGLLFKNGKFEKLLGAGKYTLFGNKEISILSLENQIFSSRCPLETLLSNEEIRKNADVVEVKAGFAALHYKDGIFSEFLTEGKYAFWNYFCKNTFEFVDFSNPKVDDIPEYIFQKINSKFYEKIEIGNHQNAVLYINGVVDSVLEAGTYYFWKNGKNVKSEIFDKRNIVFNVACQELLTQDKVSIRISYIGIYRINDFVKVSNSVDDYKTYVHNCAQLVLREYVGCKKFDDILSSKDEMSQFVFSQMKEKLKDISIDFLEGSVRDIILPGEIRDIMNTVLIAEKKAQANVIARREEVASTRSLLNTAKLMEENKTLYKLKEFEYLERIFENVSTITVNGSGDILSQLASVLGKKDG